MRRRSVARHYAVGREAAARVAGEWRSPRFFQLLQTVAGPKIVTKISRCSKFLQVNVSQRPVMPTSIAKPKSC